VLITYCIDDSVRNRVFVSFIQFLVCANKHTCTHVEALIDGNREEVFINRYFFH